MRTRLSKTLKREWPYQWLLLIIRFLLIMQIVESHFVDNRKQKTSTYFRAALLCWHGNDWEEHYLRGSETLTMSFCVRSILVARKSMRSSWMACNIEKGERGSKRRILSTLISSIEAQNWDATNTVMPRPHNKSEIQTNKNKQKVLFSFTSYSHYSSNGNVDEDTQQKQHRQYC